MRDVRLMKRRTWIGLGLSACALAACGKQSNVRTLRLAHALDESHPVHVAMLRMKEQVARESAGALRIEIYAAGQLGSERETLELLQFGSLDMTKVSGAVMESFAPEYRLFGVPYLFRDREHMFAVLDGPIGRQILESGTQARLLGLGYYDSGLRHFYTKFPVREPVDLRGKRIRVMNSQASIAMMGALGASATPLPLGDLYTALQQGVVDGAENNLPSFQLLRHYEVADNLVLDGHTAIPDVLLIRSSLWEELDARERDWLEAAARESVVYQRELWSKAEADALSFVKQKGVTVRKPDAEAFAQVGKRMKQMFRDDPVISQLMDRVEATP